MKYDVIIIGAGASGLMCAIEAGKRGRSMLMLDHRPKIASKIRISGGGRCNFGNLSLSPENYISGNKHFCRSALSKFGAAEFVSMLNSRGTKYIEKEHGRLFCAGSAMEIVNMLKAEAARFNIEIKLTARIDEIAKDSSFMIVTGGTSYLSESLVIATGGLSYPSLGASGLGYKIAKQFGIDITARKPGLVPFVFSLKDRDIFGKLSGISIDAAVSCKGKSFRDMILFTHKGLSGPGILQVSSYWDKGDNIMIDLLPDTDVFVSFVERHRSRIEMHNLLSGYFPKRFAQTWCDLYAPSRSMNRYSEKELKQIAENIHSWEIRPEDTEGYDAAEVTVGGVSTDELSSKTMESKKVSGLYFIGEVLDVTGQLGGYNLQWAWSSGFAAGQYV